MTYQEAKDKSFNVRWKTTKCGQENCWCLGIEPEEPIKDNDGEDIYIVGGGSLPKEYAEYIVNLHNKTIPCKHEYEFRKIGIGPKTMRCKKCGFKP